MWRHCTMAENNMFMHAQKQLEDCVKILDLDPNIHSILKMSMRELHVTLHVRMDDGTIRVFRGYRVHHNDALGPTKGGIRFHPDETIDTLRALASWMTWKCALLGLPLGGGKGGIACNPEELSKTELERLSRAYIQAVYGFIGPEKDIPAPDMNTNPKIMSWMMDEYSKLANKTQFGCVTGKPLNVGGSPGRLSATAQGGWYVIQEAAKDCGIELKDATIAIQGYGNVGSYAAHVCKSMFGSKIVAIGDIQGGIYNPDGLDPDKVSSQMATTGSIIGLPNTESISNAKLLEMDVDILIPAAIENVITKKNAVNIHAKIIAEMANGPTTHEADKILYTKHKLIIPDILCNAGGVTVSYLEMVQNFNMFYFDEAFIQEELHNRMTAAYRSVVRTSKKYKISMRNAAYVVAVERVVEAMKIRGWV